MQTHIDQRVDLPDTVARRLRLGTADVGLAVDDLALQVGLIDGVVVDDPEGPDTGRREVHEGRRTEATGADAEHTRCLQPLLSSHGDVRDDQVPAVPPDLLDGQGRRWLDEWGKGHAGRPSLDRGTGGSLP